MSLPILLAVGSVALGALLALTGRRAGNVVGPIRTFALASALVVVISELLPEALAELGLAGLLTFLASVIVPVVGERVRGRITGTGIDESLGLELGYLGLLVHKVGDGIGLSLFGGATPHLEVVTAIAAHSVPVTAMVLIGYRDRKGTRAAVVRAIGILVASVLGVLLAGLVAPEDVHRVEPWVSAAVAGLLLHVVAHDWAPGVRPSTATRAFDLIAIAAGVSLVLLAPDRHADLHVAALRGAAGQALVDLTLAAAPPLLLGLLLGAFLQTLRSSRAGSGEGRSVPGDAFSGAVLEGSVPLSAWDSLAMARSMARERRSPAFVSGFVLGAPSLGIETFALTVVFLGWSLAGARLLSALLAALGAAIVIGYLARPESALTPPKGQGHVHRPPGGWIRRFQAHFEDLLHHVGPWMLLGLVSAAFAGAALGPEALDGSILEAVIVAAIALPGYVCAAAAVPLAAVLHDKGLSTPAVLIALVLGPATNVATMVFSARAFGVRAAVAGIAVLALVGAAVIYAFDGAALALPAAGRLQTPALVSRASAVILGTLVLRSVWRDGLDAWLASLGDLFTGEGHRHHGHTHFRRQRGREGQPPH